MKKGYNKVRQSIMRKAWVQVKKYGYSLSDALKRSWNAYKKNDLIDSFIRASQAYVSNGSNGVHQRLERIKGIELLSSEKANSIIDKIVGGFCSEKMAYALAIEILNAK